MPLPKSASYTTDYIYALPEGQRAELIDGEIYDIAPPNRIHQELVSELLGIIREYIKKNKGACKIYPAPFAVFLNADNKNYVEPDLSIICDPDKLNDKGCIGAPDRIIEIVSPSSKRMDYLIKLFKYRTAGVHEYWIVDKVKNRILAYDFKTEDINEYSFTDIVTSAIYPDLKIDFSKLL